VSKRPPVSPLYLFDRSDHSLLTVEVLSTDTLRRDLAEAENVYATYPPRALAIAEGMERVHRRTAQWFGAEALAREITDNPGIYLLGYHARWPSAGLRDIEEPDAAFLRSTDPADKLVGYAYIADPPGITTRTLGISELEVTYDDEQAFNRWTGAALLTAAAHEYPRHRVRVDGRTRVPETRPVDYLTGMGFDPHGWGEPGGFAAGDLKTIRQNIAQLYDIQEPRTIGA
jgi:hypothetical protein